MTELQNQIMVPAVSNPSEKLKKVIIQLRRSGEGYRNAKACGLHHLGSGFYWVLVSLHILIRDFAAETI